MLYISTQMERREISIQQLESDLLSTKQLYAEAIEENGRLEARIQAFAINAQSEQDVLSGEVRRTHCYYCTRVSFNAQALSGQSKDPHSV